MAIFFTQKLIPIYIYYMVMFKYFIVIIGVTMDPPDSGLNPG